MDERKVVFLMNKYSIVVKGLEKRMAAGGYITEAITEKFEKIKDYAGEACVFIMYKPEEILSSKTGKQDLVLILDMIRDNDCDMIIIGDPMEEKDIKHNYQQIEKYMWLLRPVDPDKLFSIIGEAIRKQAERRERNAKKKEQQEAAAQAAAQAPQAVQEEKKPESESDGRKKILIVDDDPAYGGMIRQWLKDVYHVYMATAGVQAITLLTKNMVDLILLDYEMPVVDGPQVLQMLRQDEATANIPVIFLTGVSSQEGVKRVLELKPAGYLLKSTSREDILAFIKSKIGE